MGRSTLGDFEELVLLAVCALSDDAYGVTVNQLLAADADRDVSLGAVHSTLHRLQDKGYVTSVMGGATTRRGGRRKRLYTITSAGIEAVRASRASRQGILRRIPAVHPVLG